MPEHNCSDILNIYEIEKHLQMDYKSFSALK